MQQTVKRQTGNFASSSSKVKTPFKLLNRDFTAVMQIPDDLYDLLMKRSLEDFEDFGVVEVTPTNDVPFFT